MTDLRGWKFQMDRNLGELRTAVDKGLGDLRTRMDDKLEAIRRDLAQFGERLAAVETRVQALEDFIHRIGLSEDFRRFREQHPRSGDGGTT